MNYILYRVSEIKKHNAKTVYKDTFFLDYNNVHRVINRCSSLKIYDCKIPFIIRDAFTQWGFSDSLQKVQGGMQ